MGDLDRGEEEGLRTVQTGKEVRVDEVHSFLEDDTQGKKVS
jgi:hypothetical protein